MRRKVLFPNRDFSRFPKRGAQGHLSGILSLSECSLSAHAGSSEDRPFSGPSLPSLPAWLVASQTLPKELPEASANKSRNDQNPGAAW